MYGASAPDVAGVTLAGTETDAQPTDGTLACLGCHDGVSAMNSVINAPGSGGYNETGTNIGIDSLPRSMGTGDVYAVGARESDGASGFLTDDHPMSIVFTPGRAGLRAFTDTLTDFVGADKVSDLLRGGKVQCVSCHDPHTSINSRYLRNGNVGSALCIGCHEK